MTQTEVTALTSAFTVSDLVDTFVLLAPFILGVAGVVLAISIIKWGVKQVRRRLSGGVA